MSFFPFAIACDAVLEPKTDHHVQAKNFKAPQVDCVSQTNLHKHSATTPRPAQAIAEALLKQLSLTRNSDPEKDNGNIHPLESRNAEASVQRNLKNVDTRTELN